MTPPSRLRAAGSRVTAALAVLVAIAVVVGAVLRFRLLVGGQLGYDEGVYWTSLRAMDDGHPLFSSTYSSQPPAFLDLTHLVWGVLGHTLLAARLAMLGAAVVLVAGVAVLAARLASGWGGARAALVAVVVFALDPIAIRGSVMLEADLPATAYGIAAVACAVECRHRRGRAGLLVAVLGGLLLALAVLTKLFAVAFVPAILVALLVPRLPGTTPQPHGRRVGLLLAGVAGGVLGTVLLLMPHLGAAGAMWQQVVAGHLTARDLTVGGFTPTVRTGLRAQAVPAVLAVLGILALLRRRAPGDAGAAGFLVVLVVVPPALLAWQQPLWDHHLILLTPVLAVAAGVGVALTLTALGRHSPQAAVAGLVVLALLVVGGAALAVGEQRERPTVDPRVRQLQSVLPPGSTIASDNQFLAADAGMVVPPSLVDTSAVRIGSGDLSAGQVERVIRRERVAAVLFSTGKFARLPGFRAWVRDHFPRRDVFHGFTLFRR